MKSHEQYRNLAGIQGLVMENSLRYFRQNRCKTSIYLFNAFQNLLSIFLLLKNKIIEFKLLQMLFNVV